MAELNERAKLAELLAGKHILIRLVRGDTEYHELSIHDAKEIVTALAPHITRREMGAKR